MKFLMLLPVVVSVLYAVTAAAFMVKRKPEWAIVYLSYAMANVGLVLAASKG